MNDLEELEDYLNDLDKKMDTDPVIYPEKEKEGECSKSSDCEKLPMWDVFESS